ncbi:TetR/AcrR family transcriptional regulator [Celeribacter neptunius]|uniref:TetR/AcrR family transcriptional regulator n=1 Tax=Celeribacter neptunius TaxID=588602 RepID=UPI001FE9A411|nr:TetR/AcrR family transcriptional regulator [Celeribacter neptunius]
MTEVLRLADEIGPDRLSTTDVAKAVGLSQPAVFRHFPTKSALWLAVAEDTAARLRESWAAAEAQAAEPQARLKALIRAQLSAVAGTPALPSILFSRELQVENTALREVFHGLLASFQQRLVTALRDQQAAGLLQREVAAEDVAILLTSLVQGVAIRWTLGARGFPLVEEGLRLFDLQMALLRTQEDVSDGHIQ